MTLLNSSTAHEVALQAGADSQYLLLMAGTVHIAVPILAVREILEPPPFTPVPQSPDWFAGLSNLRGQILPVIELARRLRLPQREAARPVLVVIDLASKHGIQQRGLLVDSLGGIVDAKPDATKSYDAVGVSIAREFVAGILAVESEFALILNLAEVFVGTHTA